MYCIDRYSSVSLSEVRAVRVDALSAAAAPLSGRRAARARLHVLRGVSISVMLSCMRRRMLLKKSVAVPGAPGRERRPESDAPRASRRHGHTGT